MERIYLDHAATSPVHPDVFEEMKPYYEAFFGNPSSIHQFGREARRGLDEARDYIAGTIGASFEEIIFTSGGTEADNLAIIGYATAHKDEGNHLVTTKIEHHGVLHAFEYLEKQGFKVTYLEADETGLISSEDVARSLTDNTILVSVMFGNNETGAIQPVKDIGNVLKDHKAVFHTDAVQALGMEALDVNELGVDFLAASGHKINGPNGTGFLYARKGLTFSPMLYGGEQERKRRAGTENVPAIAGMKKALELIISERASRNEEYRKFRELMLGVFNKAGIDYQVNGPESGGLAHILNVSFPDVNVEAMLMNLDLEGVAASSGSACTAGSIDPSHVLTAMFEDERRSHSAIRFSFGYGNTASQVEKAAEIAVKIVRRLSGR
ncbi:cysteine desulfurase family protein [Salipaludibacillus aurantiacus]|uniref:cysteine desulfurase n=1 Tax=Salipaludibacillus aurantiacus TaxID=1601833 RepID=A0A1H9RIN3_9BACI|nr:cysteine desulfurase family protein [Salipaludibacillus aurantiacus]SER72691.1 cysteine desulfurase [Salipaludibacillus aurantiacus]